MQIAPAFSVEGSLADQLVGRGKGDDFSLGPFHRGRFLDDLIDKNRVAVTRHHDEAPSRFLQLLFGRFQPTAQGQARLLFQAFLPERR